MKVLMVISQFHPIIGGAEKQAQLLGQVLARKGVRVDIVTGWWSMKIPRRERIGDLHVFRNFSCWGMFGIKGIRTLGGLSYMISLGVHLLLHGWKYDIIHVHQLLYPAFVCVLMSRRLLRKPVIVKYACSGTTSDINQLKKFPLGTLQLNYLLKAAHCLVAMSEEGVHELAAAGYSRSRIARIPNGVTIPTEGKNYYDRVRTVVTTARLDKQKGTDVLLRAWASVVRQEKDLKLQVVGQGPAERELKGLCERLGLMEWVEFPGVTNRVEKYLEEADLFVLPSRAEGLSNALLEALSYGVPCIATAIPPNAELLGRVDESIPSGGYAVVKNGLLVNTEDAKGLSEAILYFIRNSQQREMRGRQGRTFVQESYSIDTVADKYISQYERLLEGRA
jgi:glycosyltransferase involved in cell wall biosynthesis